MEQYKIRFTKGLECDAFMLVDNGEFVKFVDLYGNDLIIPLIVEYHFITK